MYITLKDIPSKETYSYLLFIGYRSITPGVGPPIRTMDADFIKREYFDVLEDHDYIITNEDGYFILSKQGLDLLKACNIIEYLFDENTILRECAKRYADGTAPNIGPICTTTKR